jgi:superfamily II DNA or RNA helicase
MSGKRGIVFCSSVAQADRIGGKAAVHSKIKTKERNERIEQFQEREIDTLYVNKMLVEGMNLVGIDYVIIAQLDKESLTMIQKMGRGMRSDFPEIFIIVLPNSADAVYLKKNIEALPQGSVDNLMNRDTP